MVKRNLMKNYGQIHSFEEMLFGKFLPSSLIYSRERIHRIFGEDHNIRSIMQILTYEEQLISVKSLSK